jgi:hypothetical protein
MNKIVLRFSSRFWGKTSYLKIVASPFEPTPIFFDNSSASSFILVGLVVDSNAISLSQLSDE